MVVEPATPDPMVGSTGGDHCPEPRTVTEHLQVRQLVADDGLECLGWSQDQSPGERQASGP